MFIRVETCNRFVPMWKSISYINLSNVLHLEVEKKRVNIYTIFRPRYSAYQVNFISNEEAKKFAEQVFARLPQKVPRLYVDSPQASMKPRRMDEASPDPLAMAALAEWEEHSKQLK